MASRLSRLAIVAFVALCLFWSAFEIQQSVRGGLPVYKRLPPGLVRTIVALWCEHGVSCTGSGGKISGDDWNTARQAGGMFGTAFPSSPNLWDKILIVDDTTGGACDSGGGIAITLCTWNGSSWVPVSSAGGGGGGSGSLNDAFNVGKVISGANSQANAFVVGNGPEGFRLYVGTGGPTLECFENTTESCDNILGIPDGKKFYLVDEETSEFIFDIDPDFFGLGDGLIIVRDHAKFDGGVSSRRLPIDVTAATYTMTDKDCGEIIYNADAGALEVDLIADPSGCKVCFYDNAGGAITTDPNSTDTITKHGTAGAAGAAFVLAAGLGNNFCLHGTGTGNWRVIQGAGSVTEVP